MLDHENIARKIIIQKHIHPISPVFKFTDKNTRFIYEIRWDGAGISSSGNLLLFEVEMSPLKEEHIRYHLINLVIMQSNHLNDIERLIWITDDVYSLSYSIKRFLPFLRRIIKIAMSPQDICNLEGKILERI